MIEPLFIISLILLLATVIMLAIMLPRQRTADLSPVLTRLETMEKFQERVEHCVKDESGRNRQEGAEQARGLREEVGNSLKNSTDSLVQSVCQISAAQKERLENFTKQLSELKQTNDAGATQLRLEVTNALTGFKDAQEKRLSENATQLQQQFESFAARLTALTEKNEKKADELRTAVEGKLMQLTHTTQESARQTRCELSTTLKDFKDSLQKQMNTFAAQLTTLTEKNEKKSDELRAAVESKLAQLGTENANKLEEMRRTVDEKLQGTLDKRLGESFKQVSDRLEQVHKGLGEMQTLATGVGDLKRVLTNVKTRGTWGEVQLGNLLEQILTTEQYARNVRTKPSGQEAVEFAIKLPGRDDGDGKVVWLPIDAKFPKEDYERLVDAAERGDAEAVEQAAKNLEACVRSQARDIRDKYLAPPHSTDFGLLYLPTEGLYAEVLRRAGLAESVQREQRIVIVGPTTLAALLNSLQLGFRTLAIQKRSSEVWKVLGAVKTDFGKFGDLLESVKKKLDETGNTIEKAAHRSRQLERKLKKVEALPAAEAATLLANVRAGDGDGESSEEAIEG
jgi:DNA recombination protein RmuC